MMCPYPVNFEVFDTLATVQFRIFNKYLIEHLYMANKNELLTFMELTSVGRWAEQGVDNRQITWVSFK